ncbi:MAG: 50S ribosomal protein L21 [Pseudomonadota bacterium]
MFAIIASGGKQYKVIPNQIINIEKIDAEVGKEVTLDNVLLVGDDADAQKTVIGMPNVAGAKVTASVVRHELTDKVIVFKKKRRQNYRRKLGHRQQQTVVQIKQIAVK